MVSSKYYDIVTSATNHLEIPMKICSRCDISQDISEFALKKRDGLLNSWCNACNRETSKNYYRTRRGLISKIYISQKASSLRRGHNNPEYSLGWLRDWVYVQSNFEALFKVWEASNYLRDLAPSIDRLNDNLPYTKNNIRLVSWKVNNEKGQNCYTNSDNPKIGRRVIQMSLAGEVLQEFPNIALPAKLLGCSQGEISRVCMKKRKTCKGFKWEYKNEANQVI